MIEDGKSGLLVPSQDTEKFVQSIIKLLSNSELSKAMGEYSRSSVRDKFSKTRLIKDIELLYAAEEKRCL